MSRAFRYLLLILLLTGALWVRGTNAVRFIDTLRRPAEFPTYPFVIGGASRIVGSGPYSRNQILAIDGKPLDSDRQYARIVHDHRPGDKILLTLSKPGGEAFETPVTIPDSTGAFANAGQVAMDTGLDIVLPLVALILGALVVAMRPEDRNAWLLLLLMIGYSEVAAVDFGYIGSFPLVWNLGWGAMWPLLTMLFGIYFPERSEYDRRRPAMKFLLLGPCFLLEAAYCAIFLLSQYNLDSAVPLRGAFLSLYFARNALGLVAVGVYFLAIGMKSRRARSADSRRRLRILHFGSAVSLTPIALVMLWSLIRGLDILAGVPWPLAFTALMFMTLFPFTLAYAIVVERAMNLRFVIRQSIQYGVVRFGLWAVRAALIVGAIYLFTSAGRHGTMGAFQPIAYVAIGAGMLMLRRNTANRASVWVDKKFFRESYNAERVLAELSLEVGRFVEIGPLLENVAARISNTLHVPDIVILLREGDRFVPRYSTRAGEPMSIAESGRIARNLKYRNGALEIHFDKPPAWLRSLTAEELQTLDFMRTQLLLPLAENEGLTGMMSLGPKLSEVPYSETDIRLLQAVAAQMGLAIRNSMLAASLASEAAAREIAQRELEIAREVQERLFPQSSPQIPGLDCAGYCRPARGVGGDYYDFLLLEGGRLGIAVGDVSGKGIAAALLMASLQASLRGQATAGVRDLASLMRNVNRLVYEASTSNRYATFFYGEYDPADRQLTFVNAGHNPPV
ncbi:MAG: SpoIIE family protein phosphatase, partial [Acidobacteriota bacterium]|nr:SpoIIE family protein phosphatase [Acidobacteriota bacterium]